MDFYKTFSKISGREIYTIFDLDHRLFYMMSFCQTPDLGLGLGVDFTFPNNNNKKKKKNNNNNPHQKKIIIKVCISNFIYKGEFK